MSRRRKKLSAADPAELQRLHDRVFKPAKPDIGALVRAELERERTAEAKRIAEAEAARFRGGPCQLCGGTFSKERDGDEVRAGWHAWGGGDVCAWCYWTHLDGGMRPVDEALDVVTAIVRSEGVDGLCARRRRVRGIEPGAARWFGVTTWADSGAPPGARFAYLAEVAGRIREHDAEEAAAREATSVSFDEAVLSMKGRPDDRPPVPTAAQREAWRQQSAQRATFGITPAEAEAMAGE